VRHLATACFTSFGRVDDFVSVFPPRKLDIIECEVEDVVVVVDLVESVVRGAIMEKDATDGRIPLMVLPRNDDGAMASTRRSILV